MVKRAAVILLGLIASAGLLLCAAAMAVGLTVIGLAITAQDWIDA